MRSLSFNFRKQRLEDDFGCEIQYFNNWHHVKMMDIICFPRSVLLQEGPSYTHVSMEETLCLNLSDLGFLKLIFSFLPPFSISTFYSSNTLNTFLLILIFYYLEYQFMIQKKWRVRQKFKKKKGRMQKNILLSSKLRLYNQKTTCVFEIKYQMTFNILNGIQRKKRITCIQDLFSILISNT